MRWKEIGKSTIRRCLIKRMTFFLIIAVLTSRGSSSRQRVAVVALRSEHIVTSWNAFEANGHMYQRERVPQLSVLARSSSNADRARGKSLVTDERPSLIFVRETQCFVKTMGQIYSRRPISATSVADRDDF